MLRKIFAVTAYTTDGEFLMQKYAANKRTAEKIAKPYHDHAVIREMPKPEWYFIDHSWVERL